MIIFTKHAMQKFIVLKRHGLVITEKQVLATIAGPDKLDHSRHPSLIAQRKIDRSHVLRVVYKEERNDRIVITFYPGRIK
jgi:hypothetical protein